MLFIKLLTEYYVPSKLVPAQTHFARIYNAVAKLKKDRSDRIISYRIRAKELEWLLRSKLLKRLYKDFSSCNIEVENKGREVLLPGEYLMLTISFGKKKTNKWNGTGSKIENNEVTINSPSYDTRSTSYSSSLWEDSTISRNNDSEL